MAFKNRLIALMLAMLMCICLTGCGTSGTDNNTADVQSVASLIGFEMFGNNRYSGIVEAKSVQKIKADSNKTIAECKVEVGQEVKKGDVLFTYDTQSIQLSIDSATLEVEQLQSSITSYTNEIAELEKDKASAGSSEKLSYTLQIQETQIDKTEAEYNLKKKQKELEELQESAKDTSVTSDINGIVQSISDIDTDDGTSTSDTYMTIMQTGTYRVKGSVSENNIADLYQDMPVTVMSRTDCSQIWSGVISEIDTGSSDESDDEASEEYAMDDSGSSESTSKYSFYIDLDNSDNLMMGQHVYIFMSDVNDVLSDGAVELPAAFVVQDDDGCFVWATTSKDTLEKRSIEAEYSEANDSYIITSGLTIEDYIASPSDSLKAGEKVVKYDSDGSNSDDDISGDSSYYNDIYYGDGSWYDEDYSEDYSYVDDYSDYSGDMLEEYLITDGTADNNVG